MYLSAEICLINMSQVIKKNIFILVQYKLFNLFLFILFLLRRFHFSLTFD